jgi:protein-tyrosine phosphatase
MLKFFCVFAIFAGAAIAQDHVLLDPVSIGLQGAPNFRDIGGYRTTDGRHVRRGKVFRSNELSKLTPDDAAKVDSLHLAAVIDLRTEDERTKSPSVWLHRPTEIYESPKSSLAPMMGLILQGAATTDGVRRGMTEFYAQMPDAYRLEYAAIFKRIAAGDLPILVHCTAGKDRTGVAIAVLLISVGVPRKTVIFDYQITEDLLPPPRIGAVPPVPAGGVSQAEAALAQLPDDSRRALWRADPEYIQAALDSIDREYGSIDGYLERGLGLSRAQIDQAREAVVE